MTWGEAFGRASGAIWAWIGLMLISFLIIGIGGALLGWGVNDEVWAAAIFGGMIALFGLVFLTLSGFAVVIKLITDAVTDNVETRLGPVDKLERQPPTVVLEE